MRRDEAGVLRAAGGRVLNVCGKGPDLPAALAQAYGAIDFNTIALLLGMMIVVANLRLSGFFRLVNNWVVTRARHPFLLLAAIVLVAGALSAFLVNDTICLVMTPLVAVLALSAGEHGRTPAVVAQHVSDGPSIEARDRIRSPQARPRESRPSSRHSSSDAWRRTRPTVISRRAICCSICAPSRLKASASPPSA